MAVLISASLAGCESKSEKVENAQENFTETKDGLFEDSLKANAEANQEMAEAKEDLTKAKAEWETEWETFRSNSKLQIAGNKLRIQKLQADWKDEKQDVIKGNRQEINDLKASNEKLEERLNNYRQKGEDDWKVFKKEFAQDQNDLSTSINSFNRKENK
jgi:hypothetical protein